MNYPNWITRLEHVHTSYMLLGMIVGAAIAVGVLHHIGLIGWVLRGFGNLVKGSIRGGFLVWEYLFAWASWSEFLVLAMILLLAGGLAGGSFPVLRILCSVALMLMGAAACLAYMLIDLERNEVERGYKAVHNPLKGQLLAMHLKRYGKQVHIPLLISASVAVIGGFALLNQGLYETVGHTWYEVADGNREPIYADFLANSLTRIMNLVDVLNLAKSHHILGGEFVYQTGWPAKTLLAGFKIFFTMVLLHQILASLRQGKLIAETISDFWSPHEPIHLREKCTPRFRYSGHQSAPAFFEFNLCADQGTKRKASSYPGDDGTVDYSRFLRHLNDPNEHVRSVVVAGLGLLHSIESIPLVADLSQDPSPFVRQSVAEALGVLGKQGAVVTRKKRFFRRRQSLSKGGLRWWRIWRRGAIPSVVLNPVELAVKSLELALDDESTAVRTQAVSSLGQIGNPAAALAPKLISLTREGDESLRCQAAQSVGEIGGNIEATRAALIDLLQDPSSSVKATAARRLVRSRVRLHLLFPLSFLFCKTETTWCGPRRPKPSRRSDHSITRPRRSSLKA